MLPEDEVAFLRQLEPHKLTLWPEEIPEGWVAPPVDAALAPRLDAPAYYFAAERFGEVMVRPVRRGKNKGLFEIEEVRSPVFHYERSLRNEKGELVAGRVWAELDITDDPMSML